ncbi:lectin-like domain-containing protein, partial [Enterobacter cloacae complex sp.6701430]|uniref:lectin-like domain-containing protein n=1 Tax=Enterobacter cloacae complex sp.6701430 TaxID=3397176 RepID=UPI003AADD303
LYPVQTFGFTGVQNIAIASISADTLQNVSELSTKQSNRNVIIPGNEYASHFTANSGASITGDTALLTHDVEDMTGNTILNTKIDMSQSFNTVSYTHLR